MMDYKYESGEVGSTEREETTARETEMPACGGSAGGSGLEELLERYPTIRISPKGYSMYPMLIPERDQAIIEKADPEKLRAGDVVLYRRKDGMLVLHRLLKVRPEGFYMVGDNQTEVEGPLAAAQLKGRLTAFIRKGKEIRVTNPVYRLCAGMWLLLRPVRDPIKKPLAVIKRRLEGARSR